MFYYRTRRVNLNKENPVSKGSSLLLSSGNVSTCRRLLKAIAKVAPWVSAGDVAQNHEEGIAGKLLGFSREATAPSLFMHLQLVDQLVEEEPYLDAGHLILALPCPSLRSEQRDARQHQSSSWSRGRPTESDSPTYPLRPSEGTLQSLDPLTAGARGPQQIPLSFPRSRSWPSCR